MGRRSASGPSGARWGASSRCGSARLIEFLDFARVPQSVGYRSADYLNMLNGREIGWGAKPLSFAAAGSIGPQPCRRLTGRPLALSSHTA